MFERPPADVRRWLSEMDESVHEGLILALIVLFVILTTFGLLALRRTLPARVNCWFCNINSWVPYHQKNSWFCPKCEQYNGFKPDGSYNVVLDTRTVNSKKYNGKQYLTNTSNNNGLCRKCNSNQQLKIVQLAGFTPMNEKRFDSEVDAFKLHLEKVYQLCSSCRKYLKSKLFLEKRLHLNSRLHCIQNGSKNFSIRTNMFKAFKKLLHYSLKIVTITFLMCILYDIAINLDLFLSKSVIYSTKKHFKDLYFGIRNITLPYNESLQYANSIISLAPSYSLDSLFTFVENYKVYDYLNYAKSLLNKSHYLSSTMNILSVTGLVLQLLNHMVGFNIISYRHIFNDIVWGITVYNTRTGIKHLHLLQACFVIILFMNYPQSDENKDKKEDKSSKNKLKNLSDDSKINSDDMYENDSDSDVSSCLNSTFEQQRPQSQTSQNYFSKSMYSQKYPDLIECHSVKNSLKNAHGLFSRPVSSSSVKSYRPEKTFNYPKAMGEKWDVDLNQSISDLNLGCNIPTNHNNPLIFTPNYFSNSNNSLNLLMPYPSLCTRPILSPSRLSHGTHQSWVAGGYWGADNPLTSQNIHETGSSSSQSSGFESLTSSVYRNNINSFFSKSDVLQ